MATSSNNAALPVAEPDTPAQDNAVFDHKVGITKYIAKQIEDEAQPGPIARQYLPSSEESYVAPEELDDPIGDKRNAVGKAIVHRYPDRVLFLVSDHCAVYCRFCMRKHRVGKGYAAISQEDLEYSATYIESQKQVWEVILSGGDPLILAPRRMKEVIERLAAIDHLQVIRVHTRLPAADPGRITDELIESLQSSKQLYMVLHINHVSEITMEVKDAITKLKRAGITLLSQSVLLKGVNDTADDLENLLRGLVAAGVKPYYLHHPDMVPGTSHFQLTLDEGQGLLQQLRGRVSGLCWPTYVLDIPGGYGKMPICADHMQKQGDNLWLVEDYQGQKHVYPPQQKPVSLK